MIGNYKSAILEFKNLINIFSKNYDTLLSINIELLIYSIFM